MAFQEPIPSQTPLVAPDSWLITLPWIQWLTGLLKFINGIAAGAGKASYVTDGISTTDGGGVLSGGTSPLVSPTATPNDGDRWTAYLTQPAAGNELVDLAGIVPDVHLLSLSPSGTINDVSRGGSKVTALSFVCRADGEWWCNSVLAGR